MRCTVAVETGEALPRAAGVDGVVDGVAVAAESYAGTDEGNKDTQKKTVSNCNKKSNDVSFILYF